MTNINQVKNHQIIKNLSKTLLVGFVAIATGLVGSNAIAAEAQSSNKGFISKNTTEIEFAVAIATIAVGLVISEKMQRNQG